jgi:hypothetical protein
MGKFLRIILAGIICMVISYAVNMVSALLTIDFYKDPAYYQVWSKIMMPTAGPPPWYFALYAIAFSLIGGILIAVVYYFVKSAFRQKSAVKKGLFYGLLLFLVAGIPPMLSMILLINLPLMLVIIWIIMSGIVYLLDGMVVAKLVK